MNLCLICGGTTQTIAHARLAPFILELSHDKRSKVFTELCTCDDCGFSAFNNRLDKKLLDNLYRGYRGQEYLQVRNHWEPWYTKKTNAALLPGSSGVRQRIAFMESVTHSYLDLSGLGVVADIGGDSGQFFPAKMENAQKYVIDVSSKKLQPGIQSAHSLGELPSSPDLIIGSHILEHLPEPSDFLKDINNNLKSGGYLYLEIPQDLPRLRRYHATLSFKNHLNKISKINVIWKLFDFWSSMCRQLGWKIPRYGVVKESEHINYFTPLSAEKLLSDCGFEVISLKKTPAVKIGFMTLPVLGILARKL